MTISLRDYQTAACAAAENAWSAGTNRVLICLATGLGKTVVFSELIRRDHERGGRRALVLAHRDELLDQAEDKIRLVHPHASIGFVRRSENDTSRDVVLASVQSIAREKRLATLPLDFSLVVVDEAHHAVAPYHLKVLQHVGAFSHHLGAPRLLGVTATPQRADKVGLSEVFEKLVFKMPILEGIVKGYLCDLRVQAIRIRVDLSQVKSNMSGDYAEGTLGEALLAADAPDEILTAYQRSARGRKALCFTPTVEVARAVADAFNAAGIPAEWLSGETPLAQRRKILARLKSGAAQLVANAAVLTEGFDEPSVECVIVARPTKSQGLYIQMVGRGTRPSPATGKKDCMIFDVSGNEHQRLITLADITGLPASTLEKKTVLEALREDQDYESESAESVKPSGELEQMRGVNQFTEFSWSRLSGDFSQFHALALGNGGFLYVMPAAGEKYDVLKYERSSSAAAEGYMEAVAEGLPIEYAMGFAEDQVRDSAEMRLTVTTAAWRATPASTKQLDFLRRSGHMLNAPLTKGQAADLINAQLAQTTLDRLLRVQAG